MMYNHLSKILISTFVFLTIALQAQVIDIGCKTHTDATNGNDATIGLDRNNFNSGSTTNHSEGYLNNFTLPLSPAACKRISQVEVEITIISVNENNVASPCDVFDYFINFSTNCPSFVPASCDNVFNQIQAFPVTQTVTFTDPPQNFNFGENFGVDIVPAMGNIGSCPTGQSTISSGNVEIEYEICIEVTIVDDTPSSLVDLGQDVTICPGTTTLLDAGTYDSYQWGPNGEITQTINVGSGNYTVTVTDAGGCTSTDEINVNTFISPTVTFDPPNPSACDGGTTQVSITESYSQYMWSNNATGQSVSLSPGSYMVTVTDQNNCTAVASISVNDIAPPNAGIDNFINVCNDGLTYDLDALLTAHDAGGVWSDDDFSGIDVNINPMMVDFSSLSSGSFDFTYTVPGTAPCPDDQATISVQVFEQNNAGVSNTASFCPDPGTVDFFALLGNPTSGGFFNDVNSTNINTTDGSAVNLNGLAEGTYEYIYTLTSNGPCPSATASLLITILASQEAGDDITLSACEGSVIDLTDLLSPDADAGGTFSDDDGSGGLTIDMFNTAGLAGQTFDFTYELVANGGCAGDLATLTITVESSLSAGDNTTVDACQGETIDLSAILNGEDTGGAYSDVTGNGGLTDATVMTTNLPIGISEYKYLIGDGISCPKDSSSIMINVLESPTINITVDSLEICPSDCESITINLTGTAPYSLLVELFDDDDGQIGDNILTSSTNVITLTACNTTGPANLSNDTLFLISESLYYVTFPTLSDDNCSRDTTGGIDTIYMFPQDYKRFSVDTSACIGDTLIFGGIEFHEANATLNDTIPGVTCDSIIDISITFFGADTIRIEPTICLEDSILIMGTYYDADSPMEEITITNPDGCDSLIIIDLSFFPSSESLLDFVLCAGDSIIVNNVVYDDDNPIGIEILDDESQYGCDSIVNINLTFSNVVIIEVNDTLCIGDSVTYAGVVFDSSNPSGTVTDSESGCDVTYEVDLSFYTLAIGNFSGIYCDDFEITIGSTLYNADNPVGSDTIASGSINGCDSIINVNLSFYNENQVNYSPTLCEGDIIIINNNTYDINNPIGIETLENQDINGCDSIINISLSFSPFFEEMVEQTICNGDSLFVGGDFQTSAGMYADTLQSVDNCDSIIITNLLFEACQFTVTLDIVNNICAGVSNGSITVITNSPAGESFNIRLSDSDGNAEIVGFQEGPDIGGLFSNLDSDTYTITIFNTSGMTVYSETITISGENPSIESSISVLTPIACSGGTGTLSVLATTGTSPYSYEWSDIMIGDSEIAANVVSGTYTVTVTDNIGCTGTASFIFQDGFAQEIEINLLDPSCDVATDGEIIIDGLDTDLAPYIIEINDSIITENAYTNLAVDTYIISITDINNCEILDTVELAANNDLTFADYTTTYSIMEGDSIVIVGDLEDGSFTFLWSDENDDLSCNDCPFPFASPTETESYDLLITDASGCTQLVTISIDVVPQEIINTVPNAFSPNNDNINDNFIFTSGSENVTTIELLIFDRWGNKMYQESSVNGTVSWNGKMNNNGAMVQGGVYIYQIVILTNDAESETLVGDVTLID